MIILPQQGCLNSISKFATGLPVPSSIMSECVEHAWSCQQREENAVPLENFYIRIVTTVSKKVTLLQHYSNSGKLKTLFQLM
jgi:hypothetical protein